METREYFHYILAAEELEEAFDHIDEVVKDEGSSSVLVDETEN